jgi:hypothetical protein
MKELDRGEAWHSGSTSISHAQNYNAIFNKSAGQVPLKHAWQVTVPKN